MGIRTRLIAVTMAVGMLTAAVGTAAASAAPADPATSAPGKTPPKPGQPAPEPGQPAPKPGQPGPKPGQDKAILAKVAASLHVSVQQLTTALQHLKQAELKGTPKEVALAAFAKELKVSVAQAKEALNKLSGGEKPGAPEEAVKLLAAELRISVDRARQVFDDLAKLKGGKDVLKDPGFIAIAKGLGITPQKLEAALVKVKQEVGAGQPKEPLPGGTPTK